MTLGDGPKMLPIGVKGITGDNWTVLLNETVQQSETTLTNRTNHIKRDCSIE